MEQGSPSSGKEEEDNVPQEVKYNILLNTKKLSDLFSFCQTNHSYNIICGDDTFWKDKYIKDFIPDDVPKDIASWRILYIMTYIMRNHEKNPTIYNAKKGDLSGFERSLPSYKGNEHELMKAAMSGGNIEIISKILALRDRSFHDYTLYLEESLDSTPTVQVFFIDKMKELLKKKDFPKYAANSLGYKSSMKGNTVMLNFAILVGADDWIRMAEGAIENDREDILQIFINKNIFNLSDYNKLLYHAGKYDSKDCINLLLAKIGIDQRNLLYGAASGSHFRLIYFMIETFNLSNEDLTTAINHIPNKYSEPSLYSLQMLTKYGGSPKTFINSKETDIRYKTFFTDSLDNYNKLLLAVSLFQQYRQYVLDPNVLLNITMSDLNTIFDTFLSNDYFIERFSEDITEQTLESLKSSGFTEEEAKEELSSVKAANETLDSLLMLKPDLNAWLIISIKHYNIPVMNRLIKEGASNLDEGLIASFSNYEHNRPFEDIAFILVEKGASLDILQDYLLTTNIDSINDNDWASFIKMAQFYNRQDLVDKLEEIYGN